MFKPKFNNKKQRLSFKIDAGIINNRESDLVTGLKGKALDEVTLFIDDASVGNSSPDSWVEEAVKGMLGTPVAVNERHVVGWNLSGANLTGANLKGSNLTNARLISAKLNGANLAYANLYDANLYDANLYAANLNGADLTDAVLTGAIWGNTTCPDGTVTAALYPA